MEVWLMNYVLSLIQILGTWSLDTLVLWTASTWPKIFHLHAFDPINLAFPQQFVQVPFHYTSQTPPTRHSPYRRQTHLNPRIVLKLRRIPPILRIIKPRIPLMTNRLRLLQTANTRQYILLPFQDLQRQSR